MGQTWYLSVDMQLFIIAPIFVYLLWRWQFGGQISLFLALFSSILANFLVFSLLDLQPAPLYTRQLVYFLFLTIILLHKFKKKFILE